MLHTEARELVVKAYQKTHNAKEVAACFSVNPSTVYRIVQQMKRTGSVASRTNERGRKPLLQEEDRKAIDAKIKECPDITVDEILEQLHLPVSPETVRRAIIKLGYVYKKKSLHAKEQERPRCSGEERAMAAGYVGERVKQAGIPG